MNLYLHVPFCNGKCAYCAFYSEPVFSLPLWNRWLERIERELDRVTSPVSTLYLGGGTPTLAPVEELERLGKLLRSRLTFLADSERSIECNPETVTPEKASLLAEYFNRISMGAQSFSANSLRAIGRTACDPDIIRSAYVELRRAGNRNIGLDLMYALPGQSCDDFATDLNAVSELAPNHLSAYSLTIEEGTALAEKRGLRVPSDEESAEEWEMLGAFDPVRWPRYEVSNYAAPEYECRHNQAVWHGEPYLGLGPGASSFDGSRRWTEVADLRRWLGGEPPEMDVIPAESRLREIFVMGLRTVRGWRSGEFELRTRRSWSFMIPQIQRLWNAGLLECGRGSIRASEKGLLFWDEIAMELL
jgi:coproporphyrinogen dehydrogenase